MQSARRQDEAARPRLTSVPAARAERRSGEPEPWQQEALSHWPEYGAELAGTVFLVFCVVTVVAWMFADNSPVPQVVPSLGARLFLTGLLLGGAGGLVAISPLGKLSGAHLNPAASLGFWVLGKMQGQDVLGYVVAQCVGAIAGAEAAAWLWGRLAGSVQYAINQPGPHVSAPAAALGELAASFALSLLVYISISHHRTMRWTPALVTLAVGVLVLVDANFSGASMNPARSFGPAVAAGQWTNFWVYVAGPVVGTVAAAAGHRWFAPAEAKTGKLFHSMHYRSIFTGPSDHEANEHVRRHHGQEANERPRVRAARSEGKPDTPSPR